MRGASGVGLVAIGLVLLWLAITGRLQCVSQFVSCVFGGNTGALGNTSNVAPTGNNTSGGNNPLGQVENTVNQISGIIDFSRGLFGNLTPQPTPGISTQGQRI